MSHISVTIPVFNRAHLVGHTIESVLVQSFQDFDLLVVDDASTDNTVAVVQDYARHDERIAFQINPKNLGLTRNWNKCLDLAAGPLVQILLSDDIIDADYLQLVSDVFEEHPGLGFVAASCRYINSEGAVMHPGKAVAPQLYHAGDEAVLALLVGGFPHVSSIVMRRDCYLELGKYNEQIWHGPDVEMDARLAAHFDFYHFGAVHTSFRRHGSNMGALEYLRRDFLSVDMLKKQLAWSYLSPVARQSLGVYDTDAHVRRNAARAALTGATVTVAYGRPSLALHYLREALRLDHDSWRRAQFWKNIALLLCPPLGKLIMERRMRMNAVDNKAADIVERSLLAVGAEQG
jgi:glycosyltransferase involved in cell wall biosynthesis